MTLRTGNGDGDIVRTPKGLNAQKPIVRKASSAVKGSSAMSGGGGTVKSVGPTPKGTRAIRKPTKNA